MKNALIGTALAAAALVGLPSQANARSYSSFSFSIGNGYYDPWYDEPSYGYYGYGAPAYSYYDTVPLYGYYSPRYNWRDHRRWENRRWRGDGDRDHWRRHHRRDHDDDDD